MWLVEIAVTRHLDHQLFVFFSFFSLFEEKVTIQACKLTLKCYFGPNLDKDAIILIIKTWDLLKNSQWHLHVWERERERERERDFFIETQNKILYKSLRLNTAARLLLRKNLVIHNVYNKIFSHVFSYKKTVWVKHTSYNKHRPSHNSLQSN